jgi:light-regulated signal transduction histidine kinase (bacteriophytochrome)
MERDTGLHHPGAQLRVSGSPLVGRLGSIMGTVLKLTDIRESKNLKDQLSEYRGQIASNLRTSELDRHVEVAVHPVVTRVGDGTLLRAVLENFLGNAWKFTRRHERAQHVEFGTVERNGKQTYFVRDDRAGFDMK